MQRNISIKQRQRGLDEAGYIESFLILNAAGGECLDDFAHLRQDGLKDLIGHEHLRWFSQTPMRLIDWGLPLIGRFRFAPVLSGCKKITVAIKTVPG